MSGGTLLAADAVTGNVAKSCCGLVGVGVQTNVGAHRLVAVQLVVAVKVTGAVWLTVTVSVVSFAV